MKEEKEAKESIEYLKARLYGNEGCKYIDVAQEDLRNFIKLVDMKEKYIESLEKYYDEQEKNIIKKSNTICNLEFQIEKLQKENEELKNEVMEKDLEIIGKEEYTKASMKEIIEQYYTANEECIPKQRIEDIIDRIDYDIKKTKEIISKNTNIYASYRKNDYQIVRLRAMNTKSLDIKKRLQKLLESEE